jgi:hypothetical protein
VETIGRLGARLIIRFFSVGHNEPRHSADGFFLPAARFRKAFWMPPRAGDPENVLVIDLGNDVDLVVAVEHARGVDDSPSGRAARHPVHPRGHAIPARVERQITDAVIDRHHDAGTAAR